MASCNKCKVDCDSDVETLLQLGYLYPLWTPYDEYHKLDINHAHELSGHTIVHRQSKSNPKSRNEAISSSTQTKCGYRALELQEVLKAPDAATKQVKTKEMIESTTGQSRSRRPLSSRCKPPSHDMSVP